MPRIGDKPIPIPSTVKVDLKDNLVMVSGPKGRLEREIRPEIRLEQENGYIYVKCLDNSKKTKAYSGLTRSLIYNMIVGTEKMFNRKLVIEGVGYRAKVQGNKLVLHVGYSNPVEYLLPEGVTASVDQTTITFESIDKELLGQTSASIRNIRKPEPYKGKGIRYKDEHIIRKAGKAGAKK
ncbi:MAG: 50S ribosomal protein L6 [Thermodesulfobacteriota bacterium]